MTGMPLSSHVSLKSYSNFKIGGRADFLFEARSQEHLVAAISTARFFSIPFYVIGGGYNLLFDDLGFKGLMIKNSITGIKKKGKLSFFVKAGTPLKDVMDFCIKTGLTGFEFLAGIPGTVGGAVYGNAGAFGECIGDYLVEALILDNTGRQVRVKAEDFSFGYRESLLKKTHETLLEVVFRLKKGVPKDIQAAIDKNIKTREMKHPPSAACAGSYFKNPYPPGAKRLAAAVLLEGIQAKGMRCGQAAVSVIHSNFIINEGNASSKDVLELARELKKRVKEKYGVVLEEEVIYLPASGTKP